MARPWSQRPLWLALGSAGFGAAFVTGLDAPVLGQGGLLLPALAVVVGLLVGVPVAMAEARTPVDADRPLGAVTAALGEVWTTLLAAAALTPVIAALGWKGLLLAAVAWAVVGFAGSLAALAGALLIGLALLAGLVGAGMSLFEGPGFTVLEPRWGSAWAWFGPALVGGFVLSGAGFGHHAEARHAPSRAPLAALGVGTLLLVAVSLRVAAPFESGAFDVMDPVMQVLLPALGAAAVLLVALRRGTSRPGLALVGVAATALFAGPASDALPLFLTVLLPLGLSVTLVLRAFAARGLTRLTLAAGASVALAIPVVGWPGLPAPLAAALAATLPVLAVWFAGVRALRVRAA